MGWARSALSITIHHLGLVQMRLDLKIDHLMHPLILSYASWGYANEYCSYSIIRAKVTYNVLFLNFALHRWGWTLHICWPQHSLNQASASDFRCSTSIFSFLCVPIHFRSNLKPALHAHSPPRFFKLMTFFFRGQIKRPRGPGTRPLWAVPAQIGRPGGIMQIEWHQSR